MKRSLIKLIKSMTNSSDFNDPWVANYLKKHPELDSSLTEWELMKKLGFNRIWDCGNMRFELNIINKKE